MKILHLNAGNETGGGMHHILALLGALNREQFVLGVLESGELLKRANEAGITTVHFSHHSKMSVSLLRKMVHYIKREQICTIHTHGPRANVYAHMLKKFVVFRWIVTIHSDPFHDFMDRGLYGTFLSRLNMRAIRHADRIVTVSKPFQTRLIGCGIPDGKVTTTYNGIDFHKGQQSDYARKDFGFLESDFLFLMVARLEPVKGHNIALKAFSQILRKRRNCQLLLLGDGSLRKELQKLVNDLQIEEHVHFLGYQDDTEPFYRLANITLLASFSEGFPLVLLESAREKTPVISTDVGSVGALIRNQSYGWKVEAGNINALTDAMEESLAFDQMGILQKVGEELHAFASQQFSLKAFAENIYNVYLSMEDIN